MGRNQFRRTSTVYDIFDVLIITLKVMENRGGYISKNNATTTGEVPTSTFVVNYLKNNKVSDELKAKYGERANEINEYFKVSPKDLEDSFLVQVHSLMITKKVTQTSIAFIVALPWLYENIHSRTTKLMKIAEKYTSSNYMGTLGIQDTFMVKLLDVSDFYKKEPVGEQESHFFIYRVADPLGNFGMFFSKLPSFKESISESECLPIKVWDCFEFIGTPKKMEPNRDTGIKETQFSRVEITEIIGEGTEE